MNGLTQLFNSFSDLLAPIVDFAIWLFPFKIYRIHDGEIGLIKTLGCVREWRKPNKSKGLHTCFAFEEMEVVQAVGCYVNLDEQTITTKDSKVMIMNGTIIYDIICVRTAILLIEDIDDFIEGYCMNAIREHAKKNNLEDLQESEKLSRELRSICNDKIKANGVRIKNFFITDLRPHPVVIVCNCIESIYKDFAERKV